MAVLPGRYQGFNVGDKADAGDGRYIHFVALGAPGEVIIDGPSQRRSQLDDPPRGGPPRHRAGLQPRGHQHPRQQGSARAHAGILINGDFVQHARSSPTTSPSSATTPTSTGCGASTASTATPCSSQDNLFAISGKEHSAYFSDGSDDYVIRRNVFFGSNASGLQVNVDPLASLEKLARHPALEYPPMAPTREWALGLLKLATDRFGANAFPDGRGFNYIIEDNVINGNGRAGGAAINLAGVRESLIQNNLVYGNYASGIAEWDNANPFDDAAVKPGPQLRRRGDGRRRAAPSSAASTTWCATTPSSWPSAAAPRCPSATGAGGRAPTTTCSINDELPSIELYNTSIWRFDGSHNVLDQVNYEGPAAGAQEPGHLAPRRPATRSSGSTGRRSAVNFVRPGEEPWVILEGNWWKLNPKRPDFHPRSASRAARRPGRPARHAPHDLEGKPRSKADIGAYAAASPVKAARRGASPAGRDRPRRGVAGRARGGGAGPRSRSSARPTWARPIFGALLVDPGRGSRRRALGLGR